MSLEDFARRIKPRGEKMVAADMVNRLNDKYYGQWLALHVPFRKFADFNDVDIIEKVPKRYRHFAHALQQRPEYWGDPEVIKRDMMLEACGDEYIDNAERNFGKLILPKAQRDQGRAQTACLDDDLS